MKFLNAATSEMFDNINVARVAFCKGRGSCYGCPISLWSNGHGCSCVEFTQKWPEKAAQLMGYEIIREVGKDFPAPDYTPAEVAFVVRHCVERVFAPDVNVGHNSDERNIPAPPSVEERVLAKLNRARIASQLAEECNELAQAAWKLHRMDDGENPVRMTEAEVLDNMIEELADVSLCIKLLGLDTGMVRMKIYQVMQEKAERWAESLEKPRGEPVEG